MNNYKNIIWLLASMYLAGILGLSNAATQNFFQILTPFHLLTVSFFLVLFQKKKEAHFWFFFIVTTILGYTIEYIGVTTGKIFGQYQYLETLGFKILETPPIIGLNWFIMIYCTGFFIETLNLKNTILKSMLGAFLMTIFDVIVEPVAISLKMWSWENNIPPFQNYLAWFIISFLLLLFFNKSKFIKKNKTAFYIFGFQWIFFICLYIVFR